MENDEALEWLANEVEAPLLATIKRTLQAYLDDQSEEDDLKLIEAQRLRIKFHLNYCREA